jgi:hypothetical protein
MATLSLQIVSGLGTNTATLTFSAPDAQRIFTAWQNKAGPKDTNGNPIGTQAQFVNFLSQHAEDLFSHWVTMNEQVVIVPPGISLT